MKKRSAHPWFKHKYSGIFFVFGALAVVLAAGAWWISDKYVVPVLMYHNIAESENFRDDTVSPKNFDWQMNFLKTHGFHVITLTELVDGIERGNKFPHNCVALTADDGNKNNFYRGFSDP